MQNVWKAGVDYSAGTLGRATVVLRLDESTLFARARALFYRSSQ